MNYTEAKLGRIFIARFDDGEEVLTELKNLIQNENIKAGMVYILGASKTSNVVLGPKKREYPPKPFIWQYDDAREIVGFGIFALEDNEVKLHLHAGIGHSTESKVGCIRKYLEVYITTEAVIHEFTNSNIVRKIDPRYNASLLEF